MARSTSKERTEAEAQLKQLGEEVIPVLHEALEEKLSRSQGFFIFDYDVLLRLAHGLAGRGNRRSLLPLMRVSQLRPDTIFLFREPYSKLLHTRQHRADSKDCPALIETLALFRKQPAFLSLSPKIYFGLLEHTVRQVVLTLIYIAERDPEPELREALPLLRYSFSAQPFAPRGLHKCLKVALERVPAHPCYLSTNR